MVGIRRSTCVPEWPNVQNFLKNVNLEDCIFFWGMDMIQNIRSDTDGGAICY